tara:strand:+ start:307 stop:474 length:168 start_codon:yes stop_codon:yes gene_type:complete
MTTVKHTSHNKKHFKAAVQRNASPQMPLGCSNNNQLSGKSERLSDPSQGSHSLYV